MTVILDQQWQDDYLRSPHRHYGIKKTSLTMKPVLRVSPDYKKPSPGGLAAPSANDPNFLSPVTASTPAASPRSPTLAQRMHMRVRSLSGAKNSTARQRWWGLSDVEREKSESFVKDAVSLCGLAGFSWKKTLEYIQLAAELPINPQYVADADILPQQSASESTWRLGNFLDKENGAGGLLTPDSASRRSSVSRPETAASSSTSLSSSAEDDLKVILTNIRSLFETMQNSRDRHYLHYIEMPNNNLKNMHKTAVAAHRAATLKKERSSLMDAIEFDRKAEKAEGMELAVAKLRFEMELALPESVVGDGSGSGRAAGGEAKSTGSLSSRPTNASDKRSESASSSMPPLNRRTGDLRSEGLRNNRVSGVPTVVTTVSDMSHLRHLSITSSIDRPDSQASVRSEGHIQAKDTWKKLQEAKSRLSRRSKSRLDGARSPGHAQRVDDNGYFGHRPTPSDATDFTNVGI